MKYINLHWLGNKMCPAVGHRSTEVRPEGASLVPSDSDYPSVTSSALSYLHHERTKQADCNLYKYSAV